MLRILAILEGNFSKSKDQSHLEFYNKSSQEGVVKMKIKFHDFQTLLGFLAFAKSLFKIFWETRYLNKRLLKGKFDNAPWCTKKSTKL